MLLQHHLARRYSAIIIMALFASVVLSYAIENGFEAMIEEIDGSSAKLDFSQTGRIHHDHRKRGSAYLCFFQTLWSAICCMCTPSFQTIVNFRCKTNTSIFAMHVRHFLCNTFFLCVFHAIPLPSNAIRALSGFFCMVTHAQWIFLHGTLRRSDREHH